VADTVTESVTKDFLATVDLKARYMKVIAHGYGPLPKWHLGAGSPSFIFIDEIGVE